MEEGYSVSDKTNEELIYRLGKGVEIQVWDDGTVHALWLGDLEKPITVKSKTIRGALQKLVIKVNRDYEN